MTGRMSASLVAWQVLLGRAERPGQRGQENFEQSDKGCSPLNVKVLDLCRQML